MGKSLDPRDKIEEDEETKNNEVQEYNTYDARLNKLENEVMNVENMLKLIS